MTRPLITFYVITYNQERFIREAVAAALAQTWEPLEIILSDDCSTDNTFKIMTEIAAAYRGAHTIVLNRTSKNLGVGGHINAVLKLAKGEFVVASAGDDVSLPDRTERLYNALCQTSPKVWLICSNLIEVDEAGTPISHADYAAENNLAPHGERLIQWSLDDHIAGRNAGTHGASFAYRREVFDLLGPLAKGVVFEDNVFNWRAEGMGGIALLREGLVHHRNHNGQVTNISSGAVGKLPKIACIAASDLASVRQNTEDAATMLQNGWISADTYSRAIRFLAPHKELAEIKYKLVCQHYPRRLWSLVVGWKLVRVLDHRTTYLASALLPHCLMPGMIRLKRLLIRGSGASRVRTEI